MKGQMLQKIGYKSKVFLKQNSSTILTVIGGIGVVATAVTAVKATPKAIRLMEQAEDEKNAELTKMEVVKVAGPAYIPSIVIGAGTIACIFGANALSKRQQASMVSAYALLQKSYDDYKRKVEELYGENADSTIRKEIVKDNYEKNDIPLDDDAILFYDEFSQRYFEASMETVLSAELRINKTIHTAGGAYLNDFYEELGISTIEYGNHMGWSEGWLNESAWTNWLDFIHEKVVMEDGLECIVITMSAEPLFDFENY